MTRSYFGWATWDCDARGKHAAFRVTDASSLSPLVASGFCATTPDFCNGVSNRTWRAKHQPKYFDKAWRRGDAVVQDMAQHTVGGWRGYRPDAPSDWISTTADPRWAVYEVARRLKVLGRRQVDVSYIRYNKWVSPRYRGPRAILAHAAEAYDRFIASDVGRPQLVITARDFARASSEVLFYGRIPMRDVLETVTFTKDDCPIDLPEEFYKPREHRQGGSWIDHLVFKPSDSFYNACGKIKDRHEHIRQCRFEPSCFAATR